MKDNGTNVVFRSSLGGYNKDDVNIYIFNENRKFASVEHSYLKTIDNLGSDLECANKEIMRLSEIAKAYDALTAKVAADEAETAARIADIKKKYDVAVSSLTDSSAQIEALALENENIVAENDDLKRNVTVCKDELAAVKTALETARRELESRKTELSMSELSINNYRSRLDDQTVLNNELKAKLEASASELESAKESVRAAMADLAAAREELDAVKKELSAAFSENNAVKTRLLAAQNEAEEAKAKAVELRGNADSLKDELANVRAVDNSRIDSTMEQAEIISRKLLDKAKAASEEMLRRAEEGTSIILGKARDEAAIYRSDMLKVTKDIITTVSDELHRSVDLCMNDFIRGIRSIGNDSGSASDEVSRCGEEFGRRIERLQKELDLTIAAKLAEFDARHGHLR